MKVAIINWASFYSGIGKYSFNLFSRLEEKGRDVDMLFCETLGISQEYNHHKVTALRQKVYWPFIGKNILPQCFYFPSRIPSGYDIYHATSGILARVAKFKTPTIITHHDLAPLVFPGMYPATHRLWWKLLLRYYKDASRIIAISPQAKNELIDLDIVEESKVIVICEGYDEKLYRRISVEKARQRLKLPLEKKIILHIGTEEPRKDIPTLLKAISELQKDMQDIMLVRIGPVDPANEDLKRQIDVKHYQNVPEEQMSLFYNAANLFAFPSIYEGFGLPVAEAMGCGLPIIITDALELFQTGCAVVPARNPTAFAVAIREILTDSERSKVLSILALNEAAKFTVSREAAETYSLYEAVLAEAEQEGKRRINTH